MLRKTILTLGAILVGASLVCFAVVAVGVLGTLWDMSLDDPAGVDMVQRVRGLQWWGYASIGSFISACVLLSLLRDRQTASGNR